MKLFNIEIPQMAKISLVDFRKVLQSQLDDDKSVVYFTISPNPSKRYKISRFNKQVKVSYSAMTHEEQYKYLHEYISNVYIRLMEHTDWVYYIYERNENNDLHIHALMFSKSIQNAYDLEALRKTIYAHPMTQFNLKVKKDYMNNICYLQPGNLDYILEYFNKQTQIKINFPDQYIER